METDANFWHARYKQQALWTKHIRTYLINKLQIKPNKPCLEVGCGTGAVLNDLSKKGFIHLFGIDIHHDNIRLAKKNSPRPSFSLADAQTIPFPANTFHLVFCHYFLLWTKNPETIINEMRRVTQQNGYVIAFAEPDYGGRIDYPNEFEKIGKLQTESLQAQGANPFLGRKLPSLFIDAGFRKVGYGIIGGEWAYPDNSSDGHIETEVLANDLSLISHQKKGQIFQELSDEIKQNEQRVLFIPTFYAWGEK